MSLRDAISKGEDAEGCGKPHTHIRFYGLDWILVMVLALFFLTSISRTSSSATTTTKKLATFVGLAHWPAHLFVVHCAVITFGQNWNASSLFLGFSLSFYEAASTQPNLSWCFCCCHSSVFFLNFVYRASLSLHKHTHNWLVFTRSMIDIMEQQFNW